MHMAPFAPAAEWDSMIPQSFIQDLLARVDIVEVIERYCRSRRAARTISPAALPRRKIRLLLGQPHQAVLSLLRLRRPRQRDQLPDGIQRASASSTRSRSWPARWAWKSPQDDFTPTQPRPRPVADRTHGPGGALLQRTIKRSPAAIDYLKQRGLTGEIAARYGLGYAPEGWQACRPPSPTTAPPVCSNAGWSSKRRRPPLRPLSRPHHVPDPGPARQRDRLRRARARARANLGTSTRPKPRSSRRARTLRPRPGPPGGPRPGMRLVVEGYMDVVGLAPVRRRQRGRNPGTAATPTTSRSCCASPTGSCSASTATPPAAAPPGAPSEVSLNTWPTTRPSASCSCPKSTTRTASSAPWGLTPSAPP